MADTPATVVLCGRLSDHQTRPIQPGRLAIRGENSHSTRPPVTRLASLAELQQAALTSPDAFATADVALALEPAWLDSRRTLRAAIQQARSMVPELAAAVLTGAALREQPLLAELGIRVVVVDRLGPSDRGSRRPAPCGWPCRNAAWGLWEVAKVDITRRPGLWHRLTHGSGFPTTRGGSLQVLCDDSFCPGTAGQLGRWVEATARRQSRGAIRAVRLTDLPGLLEGGRTMTGRALSGGALSGEGLSGSREPQAPASLLRAA